MHIREGTWASYLRVGDNLCFEVVLCGERGRHPFDLVGDFEDTPSSFFGSARFLGPIPSFSLRAGDRIEVKELNITTFTPNCCHRQIVKPLKHVL